MQPNSKKKLLTFSILDRTQLPEIISPFQEQSYIPLLYLRSIYDIHSLGLFCFNFQAS